MICNKCKLDVKPIIFGEMKIKICGLVNEGLVTNAVSGDCPTSDWQDGYLAGIESLSKPKSIPFNAADGESEN